MPLSPSPEAFGMDENCAISTAEGEALALLDGIVTVYSSSGGGAGGEAKTKEEVGSFVFLVSSWRRRRRRRILSG